MDSNGYSWSTSQISVNSVGLVFLVASANNQRRKALIIRDTTSGGIIYVGSSSSVNTANGLAIPVIDGFPVVFKNQGPIFATIVSGTGKITYMEEYV